MEPLQHQEVLVPRKRLWKAKALLEKCKLYLAEVVNRSPDEKNNLLVTNLSRACPAWVADVDQNEAIAHSERKWYAGACRVRGAIVEAINRDSAAHGNPSRVLLWQPRIQPHPKKADAFMPVLSAKIWFPLKPMSAAAARTLVIVSDSTLQLPGVIYGLQREASLMEPTPVRLLWIAMCPGGGAKELADAWRKSPQCEYGLTVVNLNDCIKGTVYSFTDQDRDELKTLVRQARDRCTIRSDLFINHARFYPRLPPVYGNLVPQYTSVARDAGATVHDGEERVDDIKLSDDMHFSPDSTAAIVDMYISSVGSMLRIPRPPEIQHTADDRTPAAVDHLESDDNSDDDYDHDGELVLLENWRVPRESAEAVRRELLEKFLEWNTNNYRKKSVPKCLQDENRVLEPTCMPAWLPKNDDRFNLLKKKRVFVCDSPLCQEVVRFSSERHLTRYRRAECEFAGSFDRHDWDDLPSILRKEAWEKRFINAMWHCTHMCGSPVTLNEAQNAARNIRIAKYQEKQSEAATARAWASSPATSSASPPRGKGAKAGQAGKMKRSREEMEAGSSKGTKKGGFRNERWEDTEAGKTKGSKKGGSRNERQAGWRRRW